MRIENSKRSILIGIVVWLLFFGWWFRGFLFRNWQFRLFSYKSWHHLIHEFRAGWHISSKSDWIFIFSFIAAPFVFGFLWYLAAKVHWKKIWKKIWKALKWPFLAKKKKELNEAVAAYSPKQPAEPYVYRPQAMPTSGNHIQNIDVAGESQRTFLNNTTAMGDFSTGTVEPTKEIHGFSSSRYPVEESAPKVEPFTNESFAEMAETPLSEIEIPEMEPIKEDIPGLLEKAGYTLLPEISGENETLDFVAAGASKILVAMYDRNEGDWLADEESFNDEDPLWFSETDHRVSPVFQLKVEAEVLQQKLGNDFQIQPLLIEEKGTIINAEDMMKTWNDLGVTVCRTDCGGPVELPTATEILSESQEKISDEALEKIKGLL